MVKLKHLGAALLLSAGCITLPPDGDLRCDANGACPSGMSCCGGACYSTACAVTLSSTGGSSAAGSSTSTSSVTANSAASASGGATSSAATTGASAVAASVSATAAGTNGGTSGGATSTGATSTGGSSSGLVTALDAGTCVIGGTTYGAYAINPLTFCEQCLPFVSVNEWTVTDDGCGADAGGCTIDGVLVPPDYSSNVNFSFLVPNGCLICDPTTSVSAWTPAPNDTVCGWGLCQPGQPDSGPTCVCSTTPACRIQNVCDYTYDDVNCGDCGNVCQNNTLCNPQGECVPLAPLSIALSDLGVVATNGVVFVAGGRSDAGASGAVVALDTVNNAWGMVAALGHPRFAAAVTVIGNDFAVIGGETTAGTLSSEVELIPQDLSAGWRQSTLPLAYPEKGAASPNGAFEDVPLFGGDTDAGPTAEIQEWDGGKAPWFLDAVPLLGPCDSSITIGTGTQGEALILCPNAPGGSTSATFLDWYEGDSVSQLADWPRPRRGAAIASGLNGFVFVIGGQYLDGGITGDMDIYSQAQDNWTIGPPLPTPRTNLACGWDNFTNRIYCIGGFNGQFLDTVEAYLVSANTWVTAPAN